MPHAITPPSKREKIRHHVRACSKGVARKTAASVRAADDMLRDALEHGGGIYFSAEVSLGALAIAAWQNQRAPLRIWTFSSSMGAVSAVTQRTIRPTILLEESERRRTADAGWIEEAKQLADLLFGRLHSKGLACGEVLCLSSCNLGNPRLVEHYQLTISSEAAEQTWAAICSASGASR